MRYEEMVAMGAEYGLTPEEVDMAINIYLETLEIRLPGCICPLCLKRFQDKIKERWEASCSDISEN